MTTIADLLEARRGDQHLGLIDPDGAMTWGEVVAEAHRRATWLRTIQGVEPPHLGVLLPNGIDYVLWIFAAALARWAVVGINPTRRGRALAADITATSCQLILTDRDLHPLVSELDPLPAPIVISAEAVAQIAPAQDLSRETLADETDLLLLLFTSGTTGTPKAVRCTQGRLAGIAEMVVPGYGFSRDDVCYCPMPLFHGNALMALVAPALLIGATIALPRRFSASGFLDDVRRYEATMFTYVGKAIAYILATPEQEGDDENTLVRGFGTEASWPDRRRFRERFGCELVEGYGSSEGGVNITTTSDTPPGALGPATSPGTIVVDPETGLEKARALFDAAGRLLNGTESIGEIVNTDGSSRFEGYYGATEAEAERTRDGWYWSGDLAYRDEQGYFWFAGRRGDWLRVDSENLAATPIETVLARYEAFSNVAVYGVPETEGGSGDAVMVAVELRRDTIFDPEHFSAWIADQKDFGVKWTPSFVRITERLEETATGKITKVGLRHDRWNTSDDVWWRPARSSSYVQLTTERAAELDARLHAREQL